MPHLSIHLISPHACFFVSQMKNVLKGKHLADVEEVKQKASEAPKGIKINEFKSGEWDGQKRAKGEKLGQL